MNSLKSDVIHSFDVVNAIVDKVTLLPSPSLQSFEVSIQQLLQDFEYYPLISNDTTNILQNSNLQQQDNFSINIIEEFVYCQRGNIVEKVEVKGIVGLSLDDFLQQDSLITKLLVRICQESETLPSILYNKTFISTNSESVSNSQQYFDVTISKKEGLPKDISLMKYTIPPKKCPDFLRSRISIKSTSLDRFRLNVQVLFNPKVNGVIYRDLLVQVILKDILVMNKDLYEIKRVDVSDSGSFNETTKMISWNSEYVDGINTKSIEFSCEFTLLLKSTTSADIEKHTLVVPKTLPVAVKSTINDFLLSPLVFEVADHGRCKSIVKKSKLDYKFI